MKAKLFILVLAALISGSTHAQFVQMGDKLVGLGNAGSSGQGNACAISADGSTIVAGGPSDGANIGAVWIFVKSGSTWIQQGTKLIGTGSSGVAAQGVSVAISADGNTIAVGGYSDSVGRGAVWIFTRSGAVWSQQGPKLVGSGWVTANVFEGFSVALSADGNTLVEGGDWDNNLQGAVWVFTRSGGVWSQQGPKLVGTGALGAPYQGTSVAISADGNTFIEGGYQENGGMGAFWTFTRSAEVWTQMGSKVTGTGNTGPSRQGIGIALSGDGNTAAIGGYGDNGFTGAVWIFTRSGGQWTQQGTKLVGTGWAGTPYQGTRVSLTSNGNTLISGGYYDNTGIGAVWVFNRNAGTWTQQGSKLTGTGAVGAASQGISVSITPDGGTFIEGGYDDHGNLGATWVFNNSSIGISQISENVPSAYSLSQNYPNPFNPDTKFRFSIPRAGVVKVSVYDILGREVEVLVNEQLTAGTYEFNWSATGMPSGAYFYKLAANDFTEVKKMILSK